MKTIRVYKPVLVDYMNQCIGKVKYKLGAKAKLGDTPGEDFTEIDCSGFVRWLLHFCSGVIMPDGSYMQRQWCKEQGFKRNPYRQVAGLKDNRLRIAFIDAKGKKPGHVFLIINGLTIESRGGVGVSRRKWYSPILLLRTGYCYTLTDVLTN